MRVDTVFSIAICALLVDAAVNPQAQRRSPSSGDAISNMKKHIKKVVVLIMENRSVDNLLGGQTINGLDNPVNSGKFCNPMDLNNPKAGQACTAASDFNSVIDDPDHAVYGNNIEFYGNFTPSNDEISNGDLKPLMNGFVHEQIRIYGSSEKKKFLAKQVMNYYTEKQVSVLTALTQNFVTFNNWHSAIPGPTNPNRVAIHSGTSAGRGANDFSVGSMNQMSIFQWLGENGKTWKNYFDNSTSGAEKDATWFSWVTTSANNSALVQPLSSFYADAKDGTLPDYTVLGPTCCGVGTSSMHPKGLVSDGEQLIKDVYEAIRASPNWEETMLWISFDETGGFHDHVAPPAAVKPDDPPLTYTQTTPSGDNYTFEFDRLGGRVPTWLISPWVSKGHVEQLGANNASYSPGSLLRTLGYLWGFEPFTPRVESSPSFEGLFQKKIRGDTPTTLPDVHEW